jgi:hypothetical protein
VPSSSTSDTGKAAAAEADTAGELGADGPTVAVAAGRSDPVASGGTLGRGEAADPHAESASAAAARTARAAGVRRGGWAVDESGEADTSGSGRERERGPKHTEPLASDGKEGFD